MLDFYKAAVQLFNIRKFNTFNFYVFCVSLGIDLTIFVKQSVPDAPVSEVVINRVNSRRGNLARAIILLVEEDDNEVDVVDEYFELVAVHLLQGDVLVCGVLVLVQTHM